MDPGRYALQQGWDNSALDGYGTVGEPDFRVGAPYRGRRLVDDGFPGDPFYPRGLHRELVERDVYPPPANVGGWPPSRRNFDEEYGLVRESRRHDRPFPSSFHEADTFRDADRYRDNYRNEDGYYNSDGYRDYVFDRPSRFGGRDFDLLNEESYEYRRRVPRHSREDSYETDHDYGRHNYDSDYERGRKESSWRRRESRDRERDKRGANYDKDINPHDRWGRSRSRSRGHDDRSRSRSPRDGSRGRSHREDSYDDSPYDRTDKRRDRDHDDKKHADSPAVEPSATLVVKGLSQKTTEEDLYQILAEWGPLRHVRVIRERHSGSSRGFAFIDFPTTEAAKSLMDTVGDDGLVFDGRKLFFEYSSKPTGAGSGMESSAKSGHFRSSIQSDWMCMICGCVNFARRTSCFQCNEGRTEDAPLADVASTTPLPIGKKVSESGPTHVLVVRGLDENADEEILRYEFSKHAPVRDIRLVRDRFTHVSRGFAFVHFNSVEDATKALEATNGTKIERNGQVLRVAYAKSIHGPGASGNPQSSSLAAAAIEAAAFSQQYDTAGWAPKEYNPEDKHATSVPNQNGDAEAQKTGSAQSGFVWDEASGYYYDAASGFYYDGNTGLYYDSNAGTWYSYDQQTQQYIPCTDQNDSKAQEKMAGQTTKTSDDSTKKKAVISAPPATITSKGKSSLPDAIQAAAAAALAAEKKDKDKAKEIKLASKGSLLANKKKMNNVLSMWKQRNHEGQAARVVLDDRQTSSSVDDKLSLPSNSGLSGKGKHKPETATTKETIAGSGFSSAASLRGMIHNSSSLPAQSDASNQNSPRLAGNSVGVSLRGVIRSSGRGVVKSDMAYSGLEGGSNSNAVSSNATASSANPVSAAATPPFKTDLSALSSHAPSVAATSGKRRFSEMPVNVSGTKEQPQTTYRDRAAERRSLYGSSKFSDGDERLEHGVQDSSRDFSYRRGSLETGAMPFPPGVGGGQIPSSAESYEVVTSDRAIDENNVGNRMLRNMGWQEGSGLGKDGSGITEPVLAKGMDERAGLGRHQRKEVDRELEVQAGDTYRTLIQKKAIARFREMA